MKRIFITIIKILGNIKLPIIKGPLKGCWWTLGSSAGEMGGVSVLFNLSEREQLETAKQVVKKNDVCFDIGANVGIYSLLFSKLAGKVYAFEPATRNISFLYRNMKINGRKNVIICPFALADKSGLTFLNVSQQNYATGRIDKTGEPIICIKIDDFCKKNNVYPNIMKVDVEGAEYKVLTGARTVLNKYMPNILISFHGARNKSLCLKLLKDIGYSSVRSWDKSKTNEECGTEYVISR